MLRFFTGICFCSGCYDAYYLSHKASAGVNVLNFTEDFGRFIFILLGVNTSAITTEAKELGEFAIVSGNELFRR
jgi:hypothetical protein